MLNLNQSSISRWAVWLSGGLVILAGLWVMLFGLPELPKPAFEVQQFASLKPGQAGFPQLHSVFPANTLDRYRIGREGAGVELTVANFQNPQGKPESAIVYLPTDPAQPKAESGLRHDLWQSTAEAILKHTADNALFLSWWDDGQRLAFLTGRTAWIKQPVASAYPESKQRDFWQKAGGGFDRDETRLKQLARWLSMDADAALAEMAQSIPKDQPAYWLACLDDLARLSEIEALSGVRLPFEARIFPQADNIHGQIAEVRRWAEETGVSSYLVQQLPGGGARVWRITTEAGTKTLLARLLPFTTSLAHPLENLNLVYQSAWGGYLSVYEWKR